MSGPAAARRRPSTSRLDPTVRALLRSFLSPAVADTYAAALQPIAVADRDAAIAGAVSALRLRFGVLPEEMAVVLVQDTGWPVQDVATLLGIPIGAIQAELEHPDAPRIGPGETAAAPLDEDEPANPADIEADQVDAMMASVPVLERRIAEALAVSGEPDIDVEMSSTLPAHVGLASLEQRIQQSDRRQTQVVTAIIMAIIVLVGVTVNATRVPVEDVVDIPLGIDDPDPEDDSGVDDLPTAGPDTDEPSPGDDGRPTVNDVPVGLPRVAEIRFVDQVDPLSGEAGDALTDAPTTTDVRMWLRLDQRPAGAVLLEVTFTAPDATTTIRPVLLPPGDSLVAIRLPDELGRVPGRYRAVARAEGMDAASTEITLTEGGAPIPAAPPASEAPASEPADASEAPADDETEAPSDDATVGP